MRQPNPKTVTLKPGREKSVLKKHPWIFSGAIQKVAGNPALGETVRVVDSRQNFLASGAYSADSNLQVRLWSWQADEIIDADFFTRSIQRSLERRKNLPGLDKTNARRLIFSEADGLPGLIVDQYSQALVCQFLTAGAKHWQPEIVKILLELIRPRVIIERSGAESFSSNDPNDQPKILAGQLLAPTVVIEENGLQFAVDFKTGQKTGFYLDQRDNRLFLRSLARDKKVLDCFCYTGGFTLNALKGGAKSVTAIDSSETALKILKKNLKLNTLSNKNCELIEADVFQQLRDYGDRGDKFDLIILDPPKLAPHARDLKQASRAYKDLNRLALQLLPPSGTLLTFSCSGAVSPDFFQTILAWSALDAGVTAQVINKLNQAPDHPIALNFPESEYLKGLLVRV